jgi:CheY-like chemotaxis protein
MAMAMTSDEAAALKGLRVLVVEDMLLMAEVIRECLESFGCEVIGPVAKLTPALAVAREEQFDAAVLDINLAGDLSFPVADLLRSRGIAFVFVTGYDVATILPRQFQGAPRLAKPFAEDDLKQALISQLPDAQGERPTI